MSESWVYTYAGGAQIYAGGARLYAFSGPYFLPAQAWTKTTTTHPLYWNAGVVFASIQKLATLINTRNL